jgi:hypothetical protein
VFAPFAAAQPPGSPLKISSRQPVTSSLPRERMADPTEARYGSSSTRTTLGERRESAATCHCATRRRCFTRTSRPTGS